MCSLMVFTWWFDVCSVMVCMWWFDKDSGGCDNCCYGADDTEFVIEYILWCDFTGFCHNLYFY